MSELRMERRFSAPPEKVFAFVTEHGNLLKWWGPEGMTLPDEALDFSRPGPWHSVMRNSEGQDYHVSGEVLEVVAPERITISWAWHESGVRGHESKVTFSVAADGNGGSVFSLYHQDLSDAASADNHNMGWTSSLRKLEPLVND